MKFKELPNDHGNDRFYSDKKYAFTYNTGETTLIKHHLGRYTFSDKLIIIKTSKS